MESRFCSVGFGCDTLPGCAKPTAGDNFFFKRVRKSSAVRISGAPLRRHILALGIIPNITVTRNRQVVPRVVKPAQRGLQAIACGRFAVGLDHPLTHKTITPPDFTTTAQPVFAIPGYMPKHRTACV